MFSQAKLLSEGTRAALNRFRMEWAFQLADRYRDNPGSSVVHLGDLPDSVMLELDPSARPMVRGSWEKLCKTMGAKRAWLGYRGVVDYLRLLDPRWCSLGTWRSFSSSTGMDLDSLEHSVLNIRTSSGKSLRILHSPKLPFDLASTAGAKILGYRADSNYQNSSFSNKDLALHDDYASSVRSLVGDLDISHSTGTGSFSGGRYFRTNPGFLLTSIFRCAGYDCSVDQKHANSPLPLWLFLAGPEVIAACIGALWDAEGSVNYRDLKVSQAVVIPAYAWTGEIPDWPARLPISKLTWPQFQSVVSHPPRLLVSASLLLCCLGILSVLGPIGLSTTDGEVSAYWQLRVHRDSSILKFSQSIPLLSHHKKEKLFSLTRLRLPSRKDS
jgi:hypothetical protein